MEPRERLIFPLDCPSRREAEELIGELRDEVGLFKVGLELFMAAGPAFLEDLSAILPQGFFLDLKFHDIPATVSGAHRHLARGVRMTTVHVDQGRRGLEAAVSAWPAGVKVLGVTLLTSLRGQDLLAQGIDPRYAVDPPVELVLLRAALAQAAGCHGVVCAATEARAVKDRFGRDFLAVCPGIRPAWAEVAGDDQKRVLTPAEAIRAGADYLVVGRPIRRAPDPAAAARRVVAEISPALAEGAAAAQDSPRR